MSKPYTLGVLVGRFQTIHSGHESMIETAIDLCERVALFVGSSQESRTFKNPFSYEERKEMLESLFGEAVEIYPLPDIGVGNNSKWGEYVMDKVEEACGQLPDLAVSGKESRRSSWLEGEKGSTIAELYIPKTIEISATQMREHFLKDDEESWRAYTNEKLWERYEVLRQIVLDSKDELKTSSL